MARKVFGSDYPYMGDLEKKTLIALVNTHPSIDFPEPLSPNIIPVAGLQIKEPKPLPKVALEHYHSDFLFNCKNFKFLYLNRT